MSDEGGKAAARKQVLEALDSLLARTAWRTGMFGMMVLIVVIARDRDDKLTKAVDAVEHLQRQVIAVASKVYDQGVRIDHLEGRIYGFSTAPPPSRSYVPGLSLPEPLTKAVP